MNLRDHTSISVYGMVWSSSSDLALGSMSCFLFLTAPSQDMGYQNPETPLLSSKATRWVLADLKLRYFSLSSLVKRKTTYLPAYAEKRNYQTAQSLGHHKHHFKTSPKSIVQWFGIRESKCELVDGHPYQGSRVDSPTSTHQRVHRFYTSLH